MQPVVSALVPLPQRASGFLGTDCKLDGLASPKDAVSRETASHPQQSVGMRYDLAKETGRRHGAQKRLGRLAVRWGF